MRATQVFAVLIIVIGLSQASYAGTLRVQEADSLRSSDFTKTWSLPSAADTLVGRSSTDTLTNKTLSGGSNTFSQLPVATQVQQSTVTPFPNGTTTVFTLSPTPVVNTSVSVYLDGILQIQGSGLDYTISGASLTMVTAPVPGQRIQVVYSQY